MLTRKKANPAAVRATPKGKGKGKGRRRTSTPGSRDAIQRKMYWLEILPLEKKEMNLKFRGMNKLKSKWNMKLP